MKLLINVGIAVLQPHTTKSVGSIHRDYIYYYVCTPYSDRWNEQHLRLVRSLILTYAPPLTRSSTSASTCFRLLPRRTIQGLPRYDKLGFMTNFSHSREPLFVIITGTTTLKCLQTVLWSPERRSRIAIAKSTVESSRTTCMKSVARSTRVINSVRPALAK